MRMIKLRLSLVVLAAGLLISCGREVGRAPAPQLAALPTLDPAELAQGERCPSAPGPLEAGIVVNREGDLVAVAEDGRQAALTALPAPTRAYAPAWSPDGQTLAYAFFYPSPHPALISWLQIGMICGVDRQTGQARILAHAGGETESLEEAAWTPDGRALLVTHVRHVLNERDELTGSETSIVRYDLHGAAPAVVVRGAARPALSPDGGRLAYIQLGDGDQRALVVAGPSGEQRRPLLGPEGELRMLDAPRWSPDGRRLLFTASRPQAAQQPEPEGGWLDQLLSVPVARAHGDPAHLWLIGADGQGLEQLTAAPLDDPHGAWGADGRQVVYVTTLGPVVLLNVASRQERTLAEAQFTGLVDWSWRP